MKFIREFTLPRERVVPEVTRAFQLIQQSLRILEKKVIDLEAENKKLKAQVSQLQSRRNP